MASGAEVVKGFVESSPLVLHLGIRLVSVETDRAVMVLPFRPEVVTVGDVVHGGALGALIDTTAMVAAWSGADVTGTTRGTTVGYTVNFTAAARSSDVTATAEVVRRGSSLCYIDVDARDGGGTLVAKGLVTYKLG